MWFFDPDLGDVLTAVISLACRGGERLEVSRIHSVLSELKGNEGFLSGLTFSITGAVCYSRQIEETLRSLVARGLLVSNGPQSLLIPVRAALEIQARFRRVLPSSLYDSLLDASKRFYGKMQPRSSR